MPITVVVAPLIIKLIILKLINPVRYETISFTTTEAIKTNIPLVIKALARVLIHFEYDF